MERVNMYIGQCRRRRAAVLLLVVLMLRRIRQQRRWENRRIWTQPWLLRRPDYGAYNTLVQELREEDTSAFKNYFRMDRGCFDELVNLLDPYVERQDTNMRRAITTAERLAVSLRFLATGETYTSLQYAFRIGRSTIGEIIPEVCAAIYDCLKDTYLAVPRNSDDWLRIANMFEEKWNFPQCIGAMDGKHIYIQAPANSGSYYYNYKGSFSIVLLALIDADYKFTYIDVGCNGRVSDGGVFRESSLHSELNDGSLNLPAPRALPSREIEVPFVIVGDEAFPLKDNIMKPFPNKSLDLEKRIFNYRLSRARRISENAFGILSHRFRVFRSNMLVDPDTTVLIVKAACALHNFLRTKSSCYVNSGAVDSEDKDHKVIDGEWRKDQSTSSAFQPLTSQGPNRNSKVARDIRDEFKDYFITDGEVEWQWDRI